LQPLADPFANYAALQGIPTQKPTLSGRLCSIFSKNTSPDFGNSILFYRFFYCIDENSV